MDKKRSTGIVVCIFVVIAITFAFVWNLAGSSERFNDPDCGPT